MLSITRRPFGARKTRRYPIEAPKNEDHRSSTGGGALFKFPTLGGLIRQGSFRPN
jgi:hypothetical protein